MNSLKKFNAGNFTQGSALLRINYYKLQNLIVQHLPVKEKLNRCETNCKRNGYSVDTLGSVDVQEIASIGRKVVENHEGVFYREKFKISPFKILFDNLLELRQKYKDENKEVMQLLVKLIMNSLYGEQIRKVFEECYECKSEHLTLQNMMVKFWIIKKVILVITM